MTTEVLEHAAETLTRRRATLEEFWALPESMLHVEYVNGEIVMAPAPTHSHQLVSRNIFRALDSFVIKEALGEVFYSPFDIILPSGAVVQPDVFFVTAQEYKRVSSTPRLHVVPALIVEILSPGSITHDTLTKRELYEQNGVREYWIVDIEKRDIAQLVLRKKHYALTELGEGDVIRGAVLAGFESHVGELLGLK
ncbi:MAG TPA: Uma2 family endonuclease [Pyrinomonadaceae bacterium]|nr:Uma2 family endonuclease [Pyrinomonadaceae bacterium]